MAHSGSPPRPTQAPPTSLVTLYVEHRAQLTGLAAKFLAPSGHVSPEDVVQEAFLRVWRAWEGLRHEEAALAYLRQAVVNLAKDRTRRQATADRHLGTAQHDVGEVSAEEAVLSRLLSEDVVAALRALPPHQRRAVMLRHGMALTVAETAEIMNCSEGTVKSYTSRGLEAARAALARASARRSAPAAPTFEPAAEPGRAA